MSTQTIAIALIAFGALIAGVRFFLLARRSALRKPVWSVWLLQLVVAALLFFALFPPPVAQRSDQLVVVTEGATASMLEPYVNRAGKLIALPEAPVLADALREPDLATAMRHLPQATRLLVIGHGLPARDRDAARGHAVQLITAAAKPGLIELQSPTRATVGLRWQVSGATQGLIGGAIELLDPAGKRVDRAALPADGRFLLHGTARAPGRAQFMLKLRDNKGKIIEQAQLPIEIEAGATLRVLVLAGGPSPEVKYLRRWAIDAGATLHTQISLGGGTRVGDPPIALDAATLRGYDVVVLDERAWRELGAGRKAVLRDALRDGLGVVLRITGPLSPVERRELQGFGFTVTPANIPQTISLSKDWFDPSSSAPPLLSRQNIQVMANDGVALVRDDSDSPLAIWRSEGQGRIAVSWLGDSYRLALAGHGAAHGRLWSQVLATLARAHGNPRPRLLSSDPRPNQRLVLCDLGDAAEVRSPDGVRIALLIDKRGGSSCAAFWPSRAGWHVARSNGSELAFAVRAPDQNPGLRAHADEMATLELVSAAVAPATAGVANAKPGNRLPWFLAWLFASAALWWLERRCLR